MSPGLPLLLPTDKTTANALGAAISIIAKTDNKVIVLLDLIFSSFNN